MAGCKEKPWKRMVYSANGVSKIAEMRWWGPWYKEVELKQPLPPPYLYIDFMF